MATKKATKAVNIDVAAVGADLQDTLVELTDLHLRAKQAHWNLYGPLFRPVHLHLDELTKQMRKAADEVAERAVAIGYAPDGRPGTVIKSSHLPECPAGRLRDQDAISMITESLAEACVNVRHRVEHTENLDQATQDLLITVLQTLEKQHWMFDAQRDTR